MRGSATDQPRLLRSPTGLCPPRHVSEGKATEQRLRQEAKPGRDEVPRVREVHDPRAVAESSCDSLGHIPRIGWRWEQSAAERLLRVDVAELVELNLDASPTCNADQALEIAAQAAFCRRIRGVALTATCGGDRPEPDNRAPAPRE